MDLQLARRSPRLRRPKQRPRRLRKVRLGLDRSARYSADASGPSNSQICKASRVYVYLVSADVSVQPEEEDEAEASPVADDDDE